MNSFSLLTLAQKLLRRVPFATLDVNCLNCLEYYPRESTERYDDGAIMIREGTAVDVELMAKCRNFPERLPERFAASEYCVVGINDGKVIGYEWFCDKPCRIEERYGYAVEIPSDAIYGYDAFVLPTYRRAGVWKSFHARFLQDLLATLGRNRVIVMVDQNNSVSMKAHLRLGYTLYRKIYVFMICGNCFWIRRAIGRGEKKVKHASPSGTFGANTKQATDFVS